MKRFLRDYNITDYPINCFDLVEKIRSAGKIELGVEYTNAISSAFDASAVYFPTGEGYLLIIQSPNKNWLKYSSGRRQNFTIAHELAHIFLGHLEIPKKNKNRAMVAMEELEADEFAGRLLMPEKLLLKSNLQGERSRGAAAFLVSERALFMRLNNLKRLDLISAPSHPVCSRCGNDHISPVATYCSICGALLDEESTTGVRIIEYPSPLETDEHRIMLCPVCGNDDFSPSASFCKICGLPLQNNCGNDDYYTGCNHLNELNARYCECCGAQTTYSKHLKFPRWQDEQREFIKAMTHR